MGLSGRVSAVYTYIANIFLCACSPQQSRCHFHQAKKSQLPYMSLIFFDSHKQQPHMYEQMSLLPFELNYNKVFNQLK